MFDYVVETKNCKIPYMKSFLKFMGM